MESKAIEMVIYNKYVEKHIAEVLECFPLMRISTIVPLNDYPLFRLSGKLVPKKFFDSNHIFVDDIEKYNIPFMDVYVEIPFDYLEKGCLVFDTNRYINWELIPIAHRHCNGSSFHGNLICTHLPEQAKEMNNPILENLKTMYKLYLEYNNYLKTKKWNMEEYSHGDEGKREYEQRRMPTKIIKR